MSSRWLRNSFIYLLILVAVIAIVVSFLRSGSSSKSEPFSQVVAEARNGQVQSITVDGQSLDITKKNDSTHYTSRMRSSTDL